MSEPRDQAAAAAPQGGCGGAGRGAVVLSLLFSLLSVGACFLLSAKTAKLQGRLVALEEELASRSWSPGAPLGAEPLLALLQPQVDELLQEVSGTAGRQPAGEPRWAGGRGSRAQVRPGYPRGAGRRVRHPELSARLDYGKVNGDRRSIYSLGGKELQPAELHATLRLLGVQVLRLSSIRTTRLSFCALLAAWRLGQDRRLGCPEEFCAEHARCAACYFLESARAADPGPFRYSPVR